VREVRRRDAGRAARSFDASDGVGARLLPTNAHRPSWPGQDGRSACDDHIRTGGSLARLSTMDGCWRIRRRRLIGPLPRTLAGPYSPGRPFQCVAPVTQMRHQIETVIAGDCPIWPDALSERFR